MIWRLCFLGIVLSAASPGLGATHCVNNRSGDEANDGLSPETAFATIARAVQRAQTSDTISLANTGTAYREPIPLTRLGGTPAQPLVIEGNGATISGLRQLPSERWTKTGEVYEIAGPKPYGFSVDNNQFLPEQWEAFRNAVGHNEHSLLRDPKLSESHALGQESPLQIEKETIGPTAYYFETQPAARDTKSEVIKP
jgi:hypothetical protein